MRSHVVVLPAACVVLLMAALNLLGGCGRKSPVEPSPVCTVAITPASQDFPDTGGSGGIAISAPTGCPWAATVNEAWIALTSAGAGSGNGSLSYTVAANAGVDTRSGVITVSGQSHTVVQRGHVAPVECRLGLSPTAAQFGKDAASGHFDVSVASGCAWVASSEASWLIVTGGGQGSGPGTVRFEVSRNVSVDSRTGAITVAGQRFSVTQAGDAGLCDYSVTPVEIRTCMAGVTATATVTTQPACAWTASADAPWMTVRSGSAGSGSGTITLVLGDNYDAPRNARVLVRWPTPTLGQNIRVDQAGCRYAVSRATVALEAVGGPGTFDVFQQSDPTTCGGATQDRCVWAAVADVPWLTVTGATARAGDGRVTFSASPNPGTASRTGTITVRDQAVVVTQAGR